MITRKKLIPLMLVGVVSLSLAFFLFSGPFSQTKADKREEGQEVQLARAEEASDTESLIYSGTLRGFQETDLSMQVPGKLESINAEVGDKVESGQILAVSEGSRESVQKSNTLNYYRNSLSNLEKTRDLMKQQIENAKKDVEQARKNLQLVKTTKDNEAVLQPEKIREAELELEKAKTERRNIVSSLEQKERDILDSAFSSVGRGTVLANDVVAALYSMNDQKLPDLNNNFDIDDRFVGASSQLIIDTENRVVEVKNRAQELRSVYEEELRGIGDVDGNRVSIIEATQRTANVLGQAEGVVRNMKNILDNSIVHHELSRQTLEQYKMETADYTNKVQKMLLSHDGDVAGGLIGVEQALENLEVRRENQLDSIDNRIELAQQKIKLLKSSNTATDKTLDRRVEIAESGMEKAEQALATARSRYEARIQEMRTEVDRAQGQLEAARVGVNDTLLKAPYEGVVTKKYIDRGRVVNAGTPVLRVADTSRMKVVIYVPKAEAGDITVGDKAVLGHDNYPDEQWSAEVVNISPSSEQGSQKIKIELASEGLEDMKIGTYLDVELKVKKDGGNVAIPGQAVSYFYDTPVVYVVEEGRAEQRKVEIREGPEGITWISSGLKPGEQVVVEGLEGLNDGEKVKPTQ